jgi:hypothetical protein
MIKHRTSYIVHRNPIKILGALFIVDYFVNNQSKNNV